MNKNISDESLLIKLSGGEGDDIEAFEIIFHRYYPMVLNFVRGILKEDSVAEDIAQNIFMKLWLGRNSLDSSKSLKNWLCIVARNEAINRIKSKIRTCAKTHQSETASLQHVPDASSVDDWCNFFETSNIIHSKIESMPEKRREVFRMSRIEHLSNMDIAIKMNLSVRTVEKHMELALRDLRSSIN